MATASSSRRRRSSAAAAASVLPLALSFIPSQQPAATSATQTALTSKKPVAGAACGPHCGTERWPLKTMSDSGAFSVTLTPVQKSVAELVATTAPSESSDTERLNEVEKQVYSVEATLVGYKIEGGKTGDQDFHIVIQDPGTKDTMIVEIPDPHCDGVCNSTQKAAITKARSDFVKAFPDNPPSTTFVVVTGQPKVTVTGVGLYDFYHGQTGVATNCIELHPVLSIAFPPPGTFKSGHDSAVMSSLKTEASEHQCIPQER